MVDETKPEKGNKQTSNKLGVKLYHVIYCLVPNPIDHVTLKSV